MKPVIVVNFKTYKQATGENAVKLAKIHEEVARKTKANIMIAVQAADIYRVSKVVKRVKLLAQHVDYYYAGQFTGSILPEDIKENGAVGSLLNHAEKRLDNLAIENAIFRCKNIGLFNVVCTPKIHHAKRIARLMPGYIAYEVPELIGTGRSISRVKPKDVAIFSKIMKAKGIVPLCGAGISNGEDVRIAMELGVNGVLLASAITTSRNPRNMLLELIG